MYSNNIYEEADISYEESNRSHRESFQTQNNECYGKALALLSTESSGQHVKAVLV